jgi:hypothetical protein
MTGAIAGSFHEGSICEQCGELIGESRRDEPAQWKPCPKCGSTSRTFPVHTDATAQGEHGTAIHADATVQVQPAAYYPQMLLNLAQRLIDEGQFSIAVVVAHMACEIATERSLEGSVTEVLNGYNLASDRIRKRYTELTGDKVQHAAFWGSFKRSANRRNNIIHQGVIVEKTEAEESHKAATDLVAHLKKC